MSTRGALAVIAGLLVLIGLVLGFMPHSALDPDLGVNVSCGSAFAPSDTFLVCKSALSGPRWAALAIGGIGLLAGLFLMLTANQQTRAKAPVEN